MDTCAIQRPLDNKAQHRVRLEADATLAIISMCASGQLELISSDVLQLEIEQNSSELHWTHCLAVLAQASHHIGISEPIKNLARSYQQLGIQPFDAVHLVTNVVAQADYFCSCDDRLLKKAKQIKSLSLKVVSLLELIAEVG